MEYTNRIATDNNIVSTEVGRFVNAVFCELQSEGVPYAVLRNYEELPDNEGHDIDVLVNQGGLDDLEPVLRKIAREQNWCLVRNQKRYGFSQYIFVQSSCYLDKRIIKWDVFETIMWKGIPWVDSTAMLENRQEYNGFFIPSPGAEAAVCLLKEVLQFGKIRKKHLDRIFHLCREDSEGFELVLAKSFGENLVRGLFEQVHHRCWEQIESSYNRLRLILIGRMLRSRPETVFRGWLLLVLSHIRMYLTRRTGFFLCFIGPDGSGKSSISHRVSKSLADVYNGVHYWHGHFKILPELKTYVRWFRGRKTVSKSLSSPSGNSVPGRLRGLLYILYYGLDYLLGHVPTARKKGLGYLIVFDRYFYDYVIQPSSFSVDSFLFRTLLNLMPNPDAVIYLQASPETVYARKPELSIEEIARQSHVCEQLVSLLPQAYVVDNTAQIDVVASKVCEIVLDRMAESVEAFEK